MDRVLKIIKAPTGWGKSYRLRNLARESEVIFAVPTHAIAEEQAFYAQKEGIEAKHIKGRRLFVCGRKLKELSEDKRKEIEKYLLPDGELSPECPESLRLMVSQDYLCCKRKDCDYDPFKLQFEEKEPELLIITHSFMFLAPFLGDTDYLPKRRILAIDEADLLLSELERPRALVSSLSLADLKKILLETAKETGVPIKKIISQIEKAWQKTDKTGMFVLATGRRMQTGRAYTPANLKALESILREIDTFISLLPKRDTSVASLKELINHTKKLILRVLCPSQEGEYGWISEEGIGVSRLLFSSSSWRTLNSLFASLEPKEVILATATMPQSLLSLFPPSKWKIEKAGAKECEVPFPDSDLYVVVGYRDYEFESSEEYREYALSVIERFTSAGEAFVILATSFADVEALSQALKEKGYEVVAQDREAGAQKAVELWRKKGGVLIGNQALWRGLNIKEVDKFFMLKLPFASPETPKSQALFAYQQTKHFAVAREEAKNLFAQGVGRVVRENGVKKFLFILDARLKNYPDFIDVFKEVPCLVHFIELEESDVISAERLGGEIRKG